MSKITNIELFEEFYKFVSNPDNNLEDTIKEYGGGSIYIPSYKTTSRNDEIIKKYLDGSGGTKLIKKLAREYDLSEAQIYTITKEHRL